MHDTALDVATTHYYWKPALCLFRALELDAYLAAGHKAATPCLDLGCGDGSVSRMLLDAGVIDGPVVGLDYSASQLDKARALGHYERLVRASAESMPFERETFTSVVCNGVLEALPETPARAIREAARVVIPGGLFFLTVPTDRFIGTMLWPRLLGTVSQGLAGAYVRRFNSRLEHHGPYLSAAEWKGHLASSGFELVYERSFLFGASGAAYNLLIMHLLRPLRLLKSWGEKPPKALRRLLGSMIEGRQRKDAQAADREGGYVLFVGRKMPGEPTGAGRLNPA
jgi:ubiquinone/menaquinone biosynthesis C-methylase UbiE